MTTLATGSMKMFCPLTPQNIERPPAACGIHACSPYQGGAEGWGTSCRSSVMRAIQSDGTSARSPARPPFITSTPSRA